MKNLILKPSAPSAEYLKAWNSEHYTDICQIFDADTGELASPYYFRVGGFDNAKIKGLNIFKLLMMKEAYYDKYLHGKAKPLSIAQRQHLENVPVILNSDAQILCEGETYSFKGELYLYDRKNIYGKKCDSNLSIYRADTNELIYEQKNVLSNSVSETKEHLFIFDGHYSKTNCTIINKTTCEITTFD